MNTYTPKLAVTILACLVYSLPISKGRLRNSVLRKSVIRPRVTRVPHHPNSYTLFLGRRIIDEYETLCAQP